MTGTSIFHQGVTGNIIRGLQRATSIPLIAQGGQQEPPFVNHQNTLWAAMNGNNKKRWQFATMRQHMRFQWYEKDCLLRAACRTGSQMIWRRNRLHVYEFKKGNHSISAAFNKGVTRLQNTRAKNMVNYNFYQNQTNCLGLQIQLHNQNSSIFSSLKLFLLVKESLRIKSFRIKDI